MTPSKDIARLIEIMAALRTPGTGCPWDLEQTFATIAPYTIEEAYEVADAIARNDMLDLKDELGDVLWYISACADELGLTLAEIADFNIQQLAKRHSAKG